MPSSSKFPASAPYSAEVADPFTRLLTCIRGIRTQALTHIQQVLLPAELFLLPIFLYFFCRAIWLCSVGKRSIRKVQLCTKALGNELLHARKVPSEGSLILLALLLRGSQLLNRGANGCIKVSCPQML